MTAFSLPTCFTTANLQCNAAMQLQASGDRRRILAPCSAPPSEHSCNYHPGKWPFQHLTRETSRERRRQQGKITRTGKRSRGRSEERPANNERTTRPQNGAAGWWGRRRGRKPPAACHIPLCLGRLIVQAIPACYSGLRVAMVHRDGERGFDPLVYGAASRRGQNSSSGGCASDKPG